MKQLWMRLIILHHIVFFFSLSPQFLILLLLLCVSSLFKRHSLGGSNTKLCSPWDFCERCLDCFSECDCFCILWHTCTSFSQETTVWAAPWLQQTECLYASCVNNRAKSLIKAIYPPKPTFAAFHVSDLSSLNGNQWYWTLKIIKNTICVLDASFVSVT